MLALAPYRNLEDRHLVLVQLLVFILSRPLQLASELVLLALVVVKLLFFLLNLKGRAVRFCSVSKDGASLCLEPTFFLCTFGIRIDLSPSNLHLLLAYYVDEKVPESCLTISLPESINQGVAYSHVLNP